MNPTPSKPGTTPDKILIPDLNIFTCLFLTLSLLIIDFETIFEFWSLYDKSTLYVLLSNRYPSGAWVSFT